MSENSTENNESNEDFKNEKVQLVIHANPPYNESDVTLEISQDEALQLLRNMFE